MSEQVISSIKTLDWQVFINRGLQYGDGLFETMRVADGRIPLWDLHWQRLIRSAKVLQLDLPSESVFLSHLADCSGSHDNAVIKLILFRKSEGRGYLPVHSNSDWVLQSAPLSFTQSLPLNLGVAQMQLAEQPMLAGLKHLNRLEQVLLAKELAASSYDEFVVCSQSKKMIEAVSQNLLFVKNGQLYSPDTSMCGVSGVGVAWLQRHFDVLKLSIGVEELNNFDEMYLINSIRGITPVLSVEGVKKFSTDSLLRDRINGLWNELMAS